MLPCLAFHNELKSQALQLLVPNRFHASMSAVVAAELSVSHPVSTSVGGHGTGVVDALVHSSLTER